MTVAAFKSGFQYKKPKMISYRNYKHFDRNNFEKEIKSTLIIQKISPKDFSAFKNIVLECSFKNQIFTGKPFKFHKFLSKAIMHRSKSRNQFLKLQKHESRLRYNKQKNLCETLLRKAKRNYYTDLKMSDINDNKKFWKNVKPIFGNKSKGNKTVALEEEKEVITDDGKLAQTFNEYFVNIVSSLGITPFHENNDDVNNDNIDNTITKFENHLSIVAITEQMKKYNKIFTFQNVSTDKVASIFKKLNTKKASETDDIPTKSNQRVRDIFGRIPFKKLRQLP